MGADLEKLAKRVRKARVDTMQRHVLVCKECDKGSKRAKQMRKHVNLNKLRDRVTVTKVGCMDICEAEPVCVVYPEGTWYHSINKKRAHQIVEDHLRDGEVLEDAAFHVNALLERRTAEAAEAAESQRSETTDHLEVVPDVVDDQRSGDDERVDEDAA